MLVAVSAALIGRAHYVLYVQKRGNRASHAVTWLTTAFLVAFWLWNWVR